MEIDEKDLPGYKIFWVDENNKKHVVSKFKADNDDEALKTLASFKEKNKDHEYYYGHIHYVKCVDSSHKVVMMSDIDDRDDLVFDFRKKKNALVSFFEKIIDFITYWTYDKPVDWWYALKDICYLLKYGERCSNQWNLDYHLVDSIILNVPSLIKHSHGLMFIDDAIVQLHGNEKGFDLKKYHEEHCMGYPKEDEELAVKIQDEEYRKILLYAKLYVYYSNFGIVDINDKDEVKFDKTWRHTLPIKPGTYDELEYDKLNCLAKYAWENMWDWVKKYGQTLND